MAFIDTDRGLISLENGALTLRDLKTLQSAARSDKNGRARGSKRA